MPLFGPSRGEQLYKAAEAGDTQRVRQLIASKADLEWKDVRRRPKRASPLRMLRDCAALCVAAERRLHSVGSGMRRAAAPFGVDRAAWRTAVADAGVAPRRPRRISGAASAARG